MVNNFKNYKGSPALKGLFNFLFFLEAQINYEDKMINAFTWKILFPHKALIYLWHTSANIHETSQKKKTNVNLNVLRVIASALLYYLPTFTIKNKQMQVEIPIPRIPYCRIQDTSLTWKKDFCHRFVGVNWRTRDPAESHRSFLEQLPLFNSTVRIRLAMNEQLPGFFLVSLILGFKTSIGAKASIRSCHM